MKLIKVVDAKGIVTTYSYDSSSNLSEIRDANNVILDQIVYSNEKGDTKVKSHTDSYGNTKIYTYQNGKTVITDSNGFITTEWFDASYSITKTTDADGKTSIIEYSTESGINKYNEVKSYTDRNGNITRYDRDSRGNITKITNPDLSYKTFSYDSKNNRISESDEEGKYTYYIYDSTGSFLQKIVQPLNGTDVYTSTANQSKFAITSYTYYAKGENGTVVHGLVKSMTDPNGHETTYIYDSHGNLQSSTDALGNTTSYKYNVLGLCTSVLIQKAKRQSIIMMITVIL